MKIWQKYAPVVNVGNQIMTKLNRVAFHPPPKPGAVYGFPAFIEAL